MEYAIASKQRCLGIGFFASITKEVKEICAQKIMQPSLRDLRRSVLCLRRRLSRD